jgi:hypothetical protein
LTLNEGLRIGAVYSSLQLHLDRCTAKSLSFPGQFTRQKRRIEASSTGNEEHIFGHSTFYLEICDLYILTWIQSGDHSKKEIPIHF